ncbi:MAG: FAD-dependent oxidoreductase [Pseudomonadota bacterium]
MNKITLKINGKDYSANPGSTVLDVVEKYKIDTIPTLCHSKDLAPYGSCFVCVVEQKGKVNLVPSCATPIFEGMEIQTKSEKVIEARKNALELLFSNHYADCLSPCKQACPAGVDVQGYIALSAMGEYQKAADLIRETNPLPAVCGRVCVRKCEEKCRRIDVDSSVAINNIKRFITDSENAYTTLVKCEKAKGKSIGIIGAGPAGLTCAWFLGKKGYDPVIYEAMPKSGGMLRYGIPEYRLTDETLDKETDYICQAGVEIKYNIKVGKDIPFNDIKKAHDACFIATGAWAGNKMSVDGEEDTDGVVKGAPWLVKMVETKEKLNGTIVVVGGGNTAMDAARTSLRLGADKVIILYRRKIEQMPADPMEIHACKEEGIEIYELAAPVSIVKNDKNKLLALKCIRMKLGEPDASGRRRPVPQDGSEFELPCNLAISAIGQSPLIADLFKGAVDAPSLSKWDTFNIDTNTMATNLEGVFAGGDGADDGPTVVIDAIRDGQIAAKSIDEYLSNEKACSKPFGVNKEFWSKPGQNELGNIPESPRHEVHEIKVQERHHNFKEVATGFEYEDNIHECKRCLSCGCLRFSDCKLRLYAQDYGIDMNKYAGHVRKHKVDDSHPYISYDPNKCVLCAKCIRTCDNILPISALGLVGRGFKTEARPAMNDPLVKTNCISCGNCVTACPTGALTVKYPFPGRADLKVDKIDTHCGFCSIGCPITVNKISNDNYYITARQDKENYLCKFGRFGYELFIKSDRTMNPQMRVGNEIREISWEKAFENTSKMFKQVITEHGNDSVAVFVSPELTTEEMFLASQIARKGFKTNNIISLPILETKQASGVLDDSFGFTASTANIDCIKESDLIICINTNTQDENLILSKDIVQKVKSGEANLIVANSSIDSLDNLSTLSIKPFRGRTSHLIKGIMQTLIDDETINRETLKNSFENSDNFMNQVFKLDPATISDLCGIEESDIIRFSDLIKKAENITFVLSPDRQRDQSPNDLPTLANLILLLKAASKNANLLLPWFSSNAPSLEIAGCDPVFEPGKKLSALESNTKTRADIGKLIEENGIKAALILGEDPLRNDKLATSFYGLELMVTCDWTNTETYSLSHIQIPFGTYLENSGTRISFDGTPHKFNKTTSSPSGKENWEILNELSLALGVKESYSSIDEITSKLEKAIFENNKDFYNFYFNKDKNKNWDGKGKLAHMDQSPKAIRISQAMSEMDHYKWTIQDVGIEDFKVHK